MEMYGTNAYTTIWDNTVTPFVTWLIYWLTD